MFTIDYAVAQGHHLRLQQLRCWPLPLPVQSARSQQDNFGDAVLLLQPPDHEDQGARNLWKILLSHIWLDDFMRPLPMVAAVSGCDAAAACSSRCCHLAEVLTHSWLATAQVGDPAVDPVKPKLQFGPEDGVLETNVALSASYLAVSCCLLCSCPLPRPSRQPCSRRLPLTAADALQLSDVSLDARQNSLLT